LSPAGGGACHERARKLARPQAALRPTSLLGNLGQAYRQFNDPRVGTGFGDRLAYGFTGLFGIDPLKP
jgi:hypothetical protein